MFLSIGICLYSHVNSFHDSKEVASKQEDTTGGGGKVRGARGAIVLSRKPAAIWCRYARYEHYVVSVVKALLSQWGDEC